MATYYAARSLRAVKEPRPPGKVRPLLLWHDIVHERERETLTFWRLSFGPKYDRNGIFGHLEEFYKAFEIRSHILYETLGEFDILLRLWIPRGFLPGEIETGLRSHLAWHDVWNVEYMFSTSHEHWTMRGRPKPTDALAGTFVSNQTITAINEFNDRQVESADLPYPQEVEDLIDRGLIAPINLEERGIRFYLFLGRPFRPLDRAVRDDLLRRLGEECDAADAEFREHNPSAPASHISIYSGVGGSFTDYLLLGRAPHEYFHDFMRTLVFKLREMPLVADYGMRPHTHVIADQIFSECTEHRRTLSAEEVDAAALGAGESQTLEYKATFSVNLRAVLHDNVKSGQPEMKDAVVKTVCGMLNSDDGGVVVLGVLEVDREYAGALRHSQKRADALLAQLHERFHYSPPSDEHGVRRPLPNLEVGIELEYTGGGPYESFDVFSRAVSDTLRERIDPSPWPWMRMDPVTRQGHTLLYLSIEAADDWCYARLSDGTADAFFVREAASTRQYTARERDLYQRAHRPRDGGRRQWDARD